MKKLITTITISVVLFISININAQVAISTEGSNADASAMLDVKSTEKGFLPPRMTEEQRDAIADPATGLLIYQTDSEKGLYQYNGTSWIAVLSPWSESEDNIYTSKKVCIGSSSSDYQFSVINQTDNYHTVKIGLENSDKACFINYHSVAFNDPINNCGMSFMYNHPSFASSTLMVNNEPTYMQYISVGQGAARHFAWRINGMNRFIISGNGVISVRYSLRLIPLSGAPSNPAEGQMYMNSSTHKLMVFDGTSWKACW